MQAGSMTLTSEEQAMLRGERGEAVKKAIEFQIEVGKFFNAKRFVPITNAHMMGDIEVMGDGGLGFLKDACEMKTRCSIPITTNARCMDFRYVEKLGQDAGEAVKEKQIITYLKQMNVIPTDTCINYQTVYQPTLGEHIAWGDTGTVIYANSVFGARSNFESGPVHLSAAITGRRQNMAFILTSAGVHVRCQARPSQKIRGLGRDQTVGESHQNYYAVPVFAGVLASPAQMNSNIRQRARQLWVYGPFHMVGVTPGASQRQRLRPHARWRMLVTQAMVEQVYREYDLKDRNGNLVAFSGPHCSVRDEELVGKVRPKFIRAPSLCHHLSGCAQFSGGIGYLKDLKTQVSRFSQAPASHPAKSIADAD